MPYCRKCGAKLDETARFCPVCGTPVAAVAAPIVRRRGGNPYILPVAVLIAVLLAAFVLSALAFAPVSQVNFEQTKDLDKTPGVTRLSLSLQVDDAEVNIIPQPLVGKAVILNVSATGWTGIFSSTQPINVTVASASANGTTIFDSRVSHTGFGVLSFGLHVVCNVYVDPSVKLTLHVQSSSGKIALNADVPMTLDGLYFTVSTGSIETTLTQGVIIAGPISLRATTGSVHFNVDNADVSGNITATAQSTTGSVNAEISQNDKLAGNLTLNAGATTGSVNLRMNINNDVAARIESSTNLGQISVDAQHFTGNKSPIQSSNYPAGSNCLVNLRTTTGSIHITATYNLSAVLNGLENP